MEKQKNISIKLTEYFYFEENSINLHALHILAYKPIPNPKGITHWRLCIKKIVFLFNIRKFLQILKLDKMKITLFLNNGIQSIIPFEFSAGLSTVYTAF